MINRFQIRPSMVGEAAAIEELYRAAFPEEGLLPLVRDLLGSRQGVMSLVGLDPSSIIAHVALSDCRIEGCDAKVALLGPLAVAPRAQGNGAGSALVRDALDRLMRAGFARVYVLGDPGYYGRFGFETERGVEPPYPLVAQWRAAWQSVGLGTGVAPGPGRLVVGEPWLRPALWAP